jgi:hypothetical protein
MKRLKRVISLDMVIDTPSNTLFNLDISRTVPAGDDPAYMSVDVHLCDAIGNYDEHARVIKIRGIDTLEIQCILDKLKEEIAALTGVHTL